MLKLIGEELKQWDLSRKIEIITEPNKTVVKAIIYGNGLHPFDVDIKTADGVVFVQIPNFMLRGFGIITLETLEICEHGYQHKQKKGFYVDKREKPAEYTDTSIDMKSEGKLTVSMTYDGTANVWNATSTFEEIQNAISRGLTVEAVTANLTLPMVSHDASFVFFSGVVFSDKCYSKTFQINSSDVITFVEKELTTK